MEPSADSKPKEGRAGNIAAAKVLLFALLPAVVAFTAVYIVYSGRNREYLIERNYRVLATISSQVTKRLNGAQAAVKNTEAVTKDKQAGQCARSAVTQRPGPYLKILEGDDLGGKDRESPLIGANGLLRTDGDGSTLLIQEGDTVARLDLKAMLAALANRGNFDDIIVFEDPSGAVLYQRREAHTGSVPDLQTLTENARRADTGEQSTSETPSAVIRPVTFAEPRATQYFGDNYLLFFQPIRFDGGPPDSAFKPPATQWLLCGLVRTQEFTDATRRIPSLWLGALTILIIAAALAWPTLNLIYMGPRERLSGREVSLLTGSWIAATGLVVFCVMDLVAHDALSSRFDAALQTLATDIDGRFRREMGQAYRQLIQLRDDARAANTANFEKSPLAYSYFSDLILAGKDGTAEHSWIATACAQDRWTPEPIHSGLKLKDRSYFTSAQSGRLPYFRGDQGQEMNFAMQPVQARTTGENIMVLAVPVDVGPQSRVAVIGSRLVSLIRPILPEGFGFAVIQSDGEVVVHSDAKRNGVENFILECDGNRAVAAAVRTRHDASLDATYEGRPYSLFVHPLAGTEWTLVVLRDKTLLGAINVETTAVWAIVYIVYLATLLIGGLIARLLVPKRHIEWLWPDRRRTIAYAGGGAVAFLLAALVGAAAWREDAVGTGLLLLCVPPLSMSLLYLLLEGSRTTALRGRLFAAGVVVAASSAAIAAAGVYGSILVGLAIVSTGAAVAAERRWREHPSLGREAFRISYTFLLCGILAVLVGAPSFVIFMDARAQGTTAVTKHMQRQFARARNDRDLRLEREFQGSGFSDDALDARVNDDRDVYTAGLFSEKCPEDGSGTNDPPAGANGDGENELYTLLSRHFTAAAGLLVPLYSDEAGYLRRMLYDRAGDGSFAWSGERDGRLCYTQRIRRIRGYQPRVENVSLMSSAPPRPFPRTWRWFGEFLPIAFAAAAFGLAALWSVIRRLFLLDVADAGPADASADPNGSTWIYLHPDGAGLAAPGQAATYTCIDVSSAQTPEELAGRVDGADVSRARLIVVDHLAYRLGDSSWDAAKLSLIEGLAARADKTIALLSEIELVEYVSGRAGAGGTAGADSAKRWSALLARFGKRHTTGADWAGPLHDARDRRRWARCNDAERLALAQLAHEGFVSPNNRDVVEALFAKGLIQPTPAPRLHDDAWRRFVLRAAPPETMRRWEQQEEVSGWARLRTPLMSLVVVAVIFFITTQREAVNWVVGVATAATAAIPVLARAFDLLGRPREKSS